MIRNDSKAWRYTVEVGDCLIYVAVDGPHSAPHLMLPNSLGSDLTMWDPQLAAFSEHSASSAMTPVVTASQERRTAPNNGTTGTRRGRGRSLDRPHQFVFSILR